jgi:hypothetical protein
VWGALAAEALLMSCGGNGCSRKGATTAKLLSLMPVQVSALVHLDVDKLRAAKVWHRVADAVKSDKEASERYARLVADTGFDPLRDIHGVLVGVAGEGGATTADAREAVVLVRGARLNEAKLVALWQDEAAKRGQSVKKSQYGGKTLYSDSEEGKLQLAFLDTETLVFAGPKSIHQVVDLAAGKGSSVQKNSELSAVTAKVKQDQMIWGVGLVPASLRDEMKQNPQLSAAQNVRSIYGHLDLTDGVALDLNADAGAAANATQLAATTTALLGQAKQHPMVGMLGLTPIVEAIKAWGQGSVFRVEMKLAAQQFEDLVQRLTSMAESFKGAAMPGAAPGADAEVGKAPPAEIAAPAEAAPAPAGDKNVKK